MTASPAITVAIPVFNSAALIAECLESLSAETFRDVEYIVYDNASTDGTADIADGFAARDPRFTVVRRPQNVGMVANFDDGLRRSRAPFFLWRAYDDLSTPGLLAALHGALTADPQAELAVGAIRTIKVGTGKSRLSPFPHLPKSRVARGLVLMHHVEAAWFYGLYRRERLVEVWDMVHRDYPHLWAADHAMLMPFLLRGSVVGVNGEQFVQRMVQGVRHYDPPGGVAEKGAMIADFMAIARREIAKAGYEGLDARILTLAAWRHADRKAVKLLRYWRERAFSRGR